jgi:hypothetical protein
MTKTITTAILALSLTGCASIINGSSQTVVIETLDDIGTTTCTARNDEGTYRARAGEGMRVFRSSDDLVVKCENRQQVATTVIESSNEWWYYPMNFFIWDLCLISCVVDTSSGNIYEYPSQTSLLMDYKAARAEQ